MSSNAKKDIIQNGVFGVAAGLVMGGPAGAVAVAGATALLAHLQEKEDQELLRKQYEREHPDPRIEEERLKKFEEQIERRNEVLKRIKPLMEIEKPKQIDISKILYDKTNPNRDIDLEIAQEINKELMDNYNKYQLWDRVNIEFDYSRNQIRSGKKAQLHPDHSPYAVVSIYKKNRLFSSGLILQGKGKIYSEQKFEKLLLKDYDNPNLEKYNLQGTRCCVGELNVWHPYEYMYTVDNGKNFVICW